MVEHGEVSLNFLQPDITKIEELGRMKRCSRTDTLQRVSRIVVTIAISPIF